MANRYMKMCSALLFIREMQIKATMRYHTTSVKMGIIKTSKDNFSRGCREKRALALCWECKLVHLFCTTEWRFLKKLKNRTTIWSSSLTFDINLLSQRYMYFHVLYSIFTVVRIWKQPDCTHRWMEKENAVHT